MYSAQLMVRKENTSSSLPLKRDLVDLTIKTPGSRKRKSPEILDLSMDILGVEEAMKKMISFSKTVSTLEFFLALF